MIQKERKMDLILPLAAVPTQADTDPQLSALWLHGRPPTTQSVYRQDLTRFLTFCGTPLRAVTLGDLQAFADHLGGLAPATRARILSSVKSCFAFATRLGYVPFDVGRPLRLPSLRATLTARILAEGDVRQMIAREPQPRNRALLLLLYAAGLRVSELCALTWADLHARGDAGQVTVYGKGGKTRSILLTPSTWRELLALRGDAGEGEAVFVSRKKHGHLTRAHVSSLMASAAKRAGITKKVSSHWLRHAHASHALDRGAAISLVQETLGHSSVATTGRYTHARPGRPRLGTWPSETHCARKRAEETRMG
jgi:integrase/recombinase XerD